MTQLKGCVIIRKFTLVTVPNVIQMTQHIHIQCEKKTTAVTTGRAIIFSFYRFITNIYNQRKFPINMYKMAEKSERERKTNFYLFASFCELDNFAIDTQFSV